MTAVEPTPRMPVRTTGGTLVGMPALARRHSGLASQCSTTLRSVYSADEQAPPSDAFHPERWSCPPPAGSDPIFPCPEPDEADDVVYARAPAAAPAGERTMPSVGTAVAPAAAGTSVAPAESSAPTESAAPAESAAAAPSSAPTESAAPAERASSAPAGPFTPQETEPGSVEAATVRRPSSEQDVEPATLPYRSVPKTDESRLLVASALASGLVVVAGALAALLWL